MNEFICVLFLLLLAFSVFAVWHTNRLVRKRQQVYSMVMMRKPCPIEKFLNDFERVYTPDQARFIERTRYCIASLGKVSATQIYSDDSLQDTIGYLLFWHSFEEATFLNLLESQTGVSFTEESIQNVANPDPDLVPNDMTIKQFIMELLDAAEKSGGFGS